jgi:hypothetical protein
MLVSFITANINLLLFSEIFFFISATTFYIINKQLNKKTNREF